MGPAERNVVQAMSILQLLALVSQQCNQEGNAFIRLSAMECIQACCVIWQMQHGVCIPGCRSNQIENNGKCEDVVAPGQKLRSQQQCAGGSQCINEVNLDRIIKVHLPIQYANNNGVCLTIRSSPQGDCQNGEQCVGGSTCHDGKCVCPTGTSWINGQCFTPMTCLRRLLVTGSSVWRWVNVPGHQGSQVCACPSPLQAINNTCQYPPTGVLPGGACPTGRERCLGGSACQQGLCTCPLGTVVQGSECAVVERAVAGQPCSASKRCTGYAIVCKVCALSSPLIAQMVSVSDRTLYWLEPLALIEKHVQKTLTATIIRLHLHGSTINVNGVCRNSQTGGKEQLVSQLEGTLRQWRITLNFYMGT
uniref:EB domain-containing protein n=1 Tax=Ditylenchus dipsaci TaxID=166011 RepID=A0A915ECA5_9BILA